MAADRALAEDHQAAGQDVRALDRDRDRHHLVAAAEVVLRAEADALAAVHVHRVVRDLAAELRAVVLEHRGRHRRLLAAVDRAGGDRACRVHDVGSAGHAGECRLDALELADRLAELLADPCIGRRGVDRRLGAAGRVRRQRDAAADRELLHQHAPALARHLRPADDAVERQEHVLARERPVLERHVEREVATSDRDAWRAARYQRAGDAVVGLVAAEQLLGVVEPEREPDHGRDRRQRDVALREIEPEADDLTTFVRAAADDARVGDRGGVGTRARPGEREAGDVVAARESRQVMVLLFLGAVVQQQFRGAERVRHGHRRGHRGAAARELHQHARMRVGRELEAAVSLRDDHREEAFLLQEVPHVRRHVRAAVRDVPVVDHPAQLLARSVDERLLLRGEPRRLRGQQLRPVRLAAEDLAVPPDGARLERLALRVGHRGQHAAVDHQERLRHVAHADRIDVERRERCEREPAQRQPQHRRAAQQRVGQQCRADRDGRGSERHAVVGECKCAADEEQDPEDGHHCCMPRVRAGRDCPAAGSNMPAIAAMPQ